MYLTMALWHLNAKGQLLNKQLTTRMLNSHCFLATKNTCQNNCCLPVYDTLDKFLVSWENVVLCLWESETWKFSFIKQVDKSQITNMKDLESWHFECSAIISCEEGLSLEMSAFQIFHSGNSTFISLFNKTKFLWYTYLFLHGRTKLYSILECQLKFSWFSFQ